MDKLQWGNRKRLLFVKVKDLPLNGKSDCDGGSSGGGGSAVVKKKITSREIFSHSDMDKLQWGNRKRLLFVKIKDSPLNGKSDGDGGAVVKKKITSRVVDNNITNNANNCSKDGNVLPPVPSPHRSNSENPCIMETRARSRKNIKLRDEDCWIDQISRLPDELLVCILSCLSLKEAAASSILSRRWRYLWTFTSKLDFDGSDLWTTFTSNYDFDDFDLRWVGGKSAVTIRECWEYVGWVDHVLGLHDECAAVEELRISFGGNEAHKSYIDRWLRFALAKKVERLDLTLVQTYISMEHYTFPYKLLCDNDSHSWGFKHLRLIRIISVIMSDGALEIFLRSCPLLEEIFIAKCKGFSTIKIANPLPALKRLTIIHCFHLTSVEVRDSNLVLFMYRGGMLQHFLLKNVPLLVEMNVGGVLTKTVENFLLMFSSYLPQLERLTIERWEKLCIMEARMICSTVKMSNLKQLVWKFVGSNGKYYGSNLMPLTILIGALPLLQRLVLMTYADREKEDLGVISSPSPQKKRTKMVVGSKYSHLKQVEFVGYHGVVSEFEILAHIFENAAALEEVIIHPAKGTYNQFPRREYTKEDTDAFEARAKEQLTSRVPSRATLKIL